MADTQYDSMWTDSELQASNLSNGGDKAVPLSLENAPIQPAANPTAEHYEGSWSDAELINLAQGQQEPVTAAWQNAQPGVNYLAQTYAKGNDGVLRGYAGVKVMKGEMTYESAQAQYGKDTIKNLKNPYKDSGPQQFGADDLLNFTAPIVETLPFMVEMGKGALKEGTVAAGIGLAAGTAVGGPAFGGFMAKAGFQMGAGVGAFRAGSEVMAGQLYMELREAGVPHIPARNAAIPAGMIMSYIEVSQMKMLAGAARTAYVNQLAAHGWQERAIAGFKNYLGTIGEQVGEELKQEWVSFVTETVTKAQNIPNFKFPTPQDFLSRMGETAFQAVHVASVLGGASVGLGVVGKNLVRPFDEANALQHVQDVLFGDSKEEQAQKEKVRLEREKLFQLKAEMAPEAESKVTGQVISGGVTMTEKLLKRQENFQEKENARKEISKQRNAIARKAQKLADQIAAHNDKGEAAPQQLLDDFKAATEKRKKFGQLLKDVTREKKQAGYELALAEIEDTLTHKTLTEKRRAEVQLEAQAAKRDLHLFKMKEARNLVDAKRFELQAEIENTTLSIQQKEGLGKPTTFVTKKLKRLSGKIADLNVLEATLNDASISNKDLDMLIKNVPVKGTKYVVNRLLAKMVEADRRAAIAQRKDVETFQGVLHNLVVQSGIKLADRHRFMKAIQDATTKEKLRMIAGEVDVYINEFIERQDKKVALQKLNAVLDFTDPKTKGKRLYSNFEARAQKIFDKYREYTVGDPANQRDEKTQTPTTDALALTPKVLTDLNAHQTKLQAEKMAAEEGAEIPAFKEETAQIDPNELTDEDKYWIGVDTVGFRHFNAAQINQLANKIKSLAKEARIEKADRIAKKKAGWMRVAKKAQALFQGTKPATKTELINNIEHHWLKLAKRNFPHLSLMSWDQICVTLSQHSIDSTKLEDLLDLFAAIDKFEKGRDTWVNRAVDNMTVIKEDGERAQEILDLMTDATQETLGDYVARTVDENGNEQTEKRTLIIQGRADLIDLYLRVTDPSLFGGLEFGNGYTLEETFGDPDNLSFKELVVKSMRPNDFRIAMGIRKTYQEYFKERVQPLNIEETGIPLDQNEWYSGKANRIIPGKVEDNIMGFTDSFNERRSLLPGSTIPRTQNNYGVRRGNAVNNLLAHIAEFETYDAFREIEPVMRTVFGLEENQQIIKVKFGKDAMAQVQAFYTRVIGTRKKQIGIDMDLLDKWRGNLAPMYTGGKIEQIPKQVFGGIPVYLERMNPFELAIGIADYTLNKKEADAILNATGFHTTRGANITREIQERSGSGTGKEFNRGLVEKTVDILNSPPQIGDNLTTRPGNWALYKKNVRDGGFDTNYDALLDAVRFGNQTQSSSLPDQVTNFETQSPVNRWLFMFLRQPHSLWVRELNKQKRFWSNPNWANFTDAMKAFAAYRIANVAFMAASKRFTLPIALGALGLGVVTTPAEKKEWAAQMIRAFIRGNTGGVVLGDVLEYIGTLGTNWLFDNKEKAFKPVTVPYKLIEVGLTAASNLAKYANGDEKPDTKHHFKTAMGLLEVASSMIPKRYGGGFPVPAFSKATEGFVLRKKDQSETAQRQAELLDEMVKATGGDAAMIMTLKGLNLFLNPSDESEPTRNKDQEKMDKAKDAYIQNLENIIQEQEESAGNVE